MSLYRKYRPQKFEDLIGQDHVAKTLVCAVQTDKIVHSYLFSGPRGTGKTTVARILAKAVNCTSQGKTLPCGECPSCQTIAANQSVDILEIDAASNRGIDEIRELRDKVRFAPTISQYKVYIIDEVHMLTKEAFNALLKTLEEPPAHAIFILATTENHKVPPTIISRCQRYDFRRATLRSAMELLFKVAKAEKIDADKEALALIARAADGAYRDSLTLLEQISSEGEKHIKVDDVRNKLGIITEPLVWQLITQLTQRHKEASITTLNKLSDQGIDWKFLTTGILDKLRQLLFYIIAPKTLTEDLTVEDEKQLRKLSQATSETEIVSLMNAMLKAEASLRTSTIPDIPVLAAMIEYLNTESQKSKVKSQNDNLKVTEHGHPELTPVTKDLNSSQTPPRDLSSNPLSPNPKSSNSKDNVSRPALVTSQESPVASEQWTKIVTQVKEKNTTLAGLLAQSHPFITDQALIVEVPYSFWEDRVKSSKANSLITEAAETILKKKVKIIARSNGSLRAKYQSEVVKQDQKIKKEAQEIFG
jgi:DNA polymerase-3 subunit gamma/tau